MINKKVTETIKSKREYKLDLFGDTMKSMCNKTLLSIKSDEKILKSCLSENGSPKNNKKVTFNLKPIENHEFEKQKAMFHNKDIDSPFNSLEELRVLEDNTVMVMNHQYYLKYMKEKYPRVDSCQTFLSDSEPEEDLNINFEASLENKKIVEKIIVLDEKEKEIINKKIIYSVSQEVIIEIPTEKLEKTIIQKKIENQQLSSKIGESEIIKKEVIKTKNDEKKKIGENKPISSKFNVNKKTEKNIAKDNNIFIIDNITIKSTLKNTAIKPTIQNNLSEKLYIETPKEKLFPQKETTTKLYPKSEEKNKQFSSVKFELKKLEESQKGNTKKLTSLFEKIIADSL